MVLVTFLPPVFSRLFPSSENFLFSPTAHLQLTRLPCSAFLRHTEFNSSCMDMADGEVIYWIRGNLSVATTPKKTMLSCPWQWWGGVGSQEGLSIHDGASVSPILFRLQELLWVCECRDGDILTCSGQDIDSYLFWTLGLVTSPFVNHCSQTECSSTTSGSSAILQL